MYGLVRRLLFLVPPERIHTLVFAVLRGVTTVAPVRRVLHRLLGPADPVLTSTVFVAAWTLSASAFTRATSKSRLPVLVTPWALVVVNVRV